jgi:RNA polymerase sigma-70 factor (ECF subfamily)
VTLRARSAVATPSEVDLIRALAGGDLKALGTLFERHESAVRAYVGRLGVAPSDADDLVQATFLEVVRAADRFDPTYGSPNARGDAAAATRSWLFGIATWMVRRHQRSLRRRAARLLSWASLAANQTAPAQTPYEIVDAERSVDRLMRALERLSAPKREVFVLVTMEGMSGEDVARTLGIPVNTVWTRLHHARLELRKALSEVSR